MNVNENQYKVTFKIEHEEEGVYTREFTIDDDTVWTDHLCAYLNFLGSVYGYPITDKVAVGGMVWGKWIQEQRPTFDMKTEEVKHWNDAGYGEAPGFANTDEE